MSSADAADFIAAAEPADAAADGNHIVTVTCNAPRQLLSADRASKHLRPGAGDFNHCQSDRFIVVAECHHGATGAEARRA